MSKKNRAPKGCHYGEPNYWQSADFYKSSELMFRQWIMQLAINRFRWVGLPDTCDASILETTLHRYGTAAICKPDSDDLPPIWYSLPAVIDGKLTAYGEPTAWRCNGIAGETHFRSSWKNGAFIFYNTARLTTGNQFGFYNALKLFAARLAHLTRTEDVNLFHQQMPLVIIGDDQFKRDMLNLVKQISNGEPAVVANRTFDTLDIKAIETGKEYIGLDLNLALSNQFAMLYRYLGIDHLPFEKSERMISEEVRGNSYPTNLMLLDCLQSRRKAADYLNRTFGTEIEVYFNNDFESYNFNFISDIERVAQSELIAPAPIDQDSDGVTNEE